MQRGTLFYTVYVFGHIYLAINKMVKYSGTVRTCTYVLNLQRKLIEPVCTLDNLVKEQNAFSACECTALLHFAYIVPKNYISVMSGTT